MRIGQRLRTWVISLALLVAALLAISGCGGTPTPLVTGTPSAPADTPESTHTPEPTSTPTATPASTSIDPTAVIAPTSGPPGTAVMVTAAGFPPNAPVDIGFGRPESEYDVIATAQSDAQGRVSTSFEIPTYADPGDLWVVVVVTEDREVQVVSEPFQVVASSATPTPSPTAESGLFTHTNIYLIAVGDAGQSGDLIGCDDSVVPVEVEIEPTIAPLTAALERLFAFDPEAEGYPDLYNALHQSDLTVDGINIVAGEATIALSGELILGGACDNPRVEAQLEWTALQYSTVDQVSITLNGEPLEDVLSLQ